MIQAEQKILKSAIINASNKVFIAFIIVVLVVINTLKLSASDETSEKVIISENSTLVIAASDSAKVLIKGGKITASEGKSIRLLPGTKIKCGDQITVSISDKKDQELIARQIEKEKEEKMLAEASKERNEIKQSAIIPSFIFFNQLPAKEETVGQQKTELVASVVNTTISFASPFFLIKRENLNKTEDKDINKTTSIILISKSWGEESATIKVLRC
jgi:ribosomal 50S subunit-recycling heat shock protein